MTLSLTEQSNVKYTRIVVSLLSSINIVDDIPRLLSESEYTYLISKHSYKTSNQAFLHNWSNFYEFDLGQTRKSFVSVGRGSTFQE